MSGNHNKYQKSIQKIAQEPDYEKRLSLAAESMGENVLSMIKHILRKHDAAIIEASFEAIEAAVKEERRSIIRVLEGGIVEKEHVEYPMNAALDWAIAAIEERGI
jgi:ribosomal protein S20